MGIVSIDGTKDSWSVPPAQADTAESNSLGDITAATPENHEPDPALRELDSIS